jgi:hypothetical protein
LPNSQRILQLVISDKWGTCGMLRHCLIHPDAPLLSLLGPLFRPSFSPVDDVPDAAYLRFNPLKSHGFVLLFTHFAGHTGVFLPVIRAKTGGAHAELPQGRDGDHDCEKGRLAWRFPAGSLAGKQFTLPGEPVRPPDRAYLLTTQHLLGKMGGAG